MRYIKKIIIKQNLNYIKIKRIIDYCKSIKTVEKHLYSLGVTERRVVQYFGENNQSYQA